MIPLTHLIVFRQLYARLAETDINWVVTGSFSFALQGAPITPDDIDLQTDKAGAYAIERSFAQYVTRNVTFVTSEQIRSHLGALMIDAITVEIMGDIQKRLADGTWEEPLDLMQHRQFIAFEHMSIPVLSLEYEYQAYMKLGRIEKARMLQRMVQEKKRKHTSS
ncbi:MAG TPA: hypothetical protein VKY19_28530 [Ktedonosporobacter sp.]|nr:hypothetical protein [Ktedonosporobacter sp.]